MNQTDLEGETERALRANRFVMTRKVIQAALFGKPISGAQAAEATRELEYHSCGKHPDVTWEGAAMCPTCQIEAEQAMAGAYAAAAKAVCPHCAAGDIPKLSGIGSGFYWHTPGPYCEATKIRALTPADARQARGRQELLEEIANEIKSDGLCLPINHRGLLDYLERLAAARTQKLGFHLYEPVFSAAGDPRTCSVCGLSEDNYYHKAARSLAGGTDVKSPDNS